MALFRGEQISGSVASASYALTASYAQNAGTTIDTGSFITTSSFGAFTASYTTGSFSGSFQGSFTGDGSALSGITATVAPAGPITSVQFNDGLNTSGSSDFTFDKTTGLVSATSMSIANIYYPSSDGTDRQVIKTDGAGNLEFGYPEAITVQVYNSDSITLQKGTPVHATSSGTIGNLTGVVLADASDITRIPATAVLNETLAPGESGEAILSGYIRGVNTVGFTSGHVIYLAPGGGYTQTKPTGSAYIQNLGIVTKIDPTNGAGMVFGSGRTNDVPNILPGYTWLGNNDYVPIPVSSASLFVNSASFALTASYVTPLQQDVQITGSLLLTGSHIAAVDYIDFNNTGIAPPADLEGRIYWDEDNGTLSLGMHGSQVVQQIGLENYYYVKNQTGTTLLNGTVIRSAGTLGSSGRLLGDLMIADGTIPYYYALGIATEDIIDGDDGYVTQFGLVRGINTTGSNGETWVDGDILYVSPTVAGTLTKFEPEAPNLRLQMAIVVHADTNGSLFVRPDLGSSVGSLHDVIDFTTTASYGELFVKSGSVWTSTKQLTGSYAITGSLTATSFIGSLTGTASYANTSITASYVQTAQTASYALNVVSSSYALTASYALNSSGGGSTDTGSLLVTASAALNVITFTKGDGSTFPITVDTGSGGGGATDTGSLLVTASISQNTFTFTKGDSSTFDLVFETSSFVLNSQTSSMSVATASYVLASNVDGTVVSSSYAITSSYALSGGDAPFPYTGSAQITGSLEVTGPVTITYENTPALVVYGSGSVDSVFIVSGSTGELFTVTDTVTGDLFTVTDADSNSIFNISASYDIYLGNPIATSLYATTTASIGLTPVTIYTIPTASYEGAWFEYTVRSGSNSRAGQIMSIWDSTSVNFTETTTIDFGDTTGVNLGILIIGNSIAFTGSATTDSWSLRTIIRGI